MSSALAGVTLAVALSTSCAINGTTEYKIDTPIVDKPTVTYESVLITADEMKNKNTVAIPPYASLFDANNSFNANKMPSIASLNNNNWNANSLLLPSFPNTLSVMSNNTSISMLEESDAFYKDNNDDDLVVYQNKHYASNNKNTIDYAQNNSVLTINDDDTQDMIAEKNLLSEIYDEQMAIKNNDSLSDEEKEQAYRNNIVNLASNCEGKFIYNFGSLVDGNYLIDQYSDCSTYTQFVVYWATGIDITSATGSQTTSAIKDNILSFIEYEDLKPGDLGFIFSYDEKDLSPYYKQRTITREDAQNSIVQVVGTSDNEETVASDENNIEETTTSDIEGQTETSDDDLITQTILINHTGIYMGKDKDGNDLWCHCTSSGDMAVVINNYAKFTKYARVNFK